MSPISDIGAFRNSRWKLDDFLRALRLGIEWAIEHRAVFDLLAHPSVLYPNDPDFRVIELICDLVRRAGDRAMLTDLDAIARQVRDVAERGVEVALVVGAGNTGAEIAAEICRTHPTWLSGPDTGHIPVRSGSRWDRLITPPFWWLASRVLTVQTPIGRKIRPKALTTTAPLERVRPKDLAAAGVTRVPRTIGVRDGLPMLDGGRVMDVATVLWCTGFRPDFAWVDLPVFDQDGTPTHHRGVVRSQPGLYFLGLWFLTAFTSSLLGGVGSDAEYIAEQITSRTPASRPPATVPTTAGDADKFD